jgi:hypothetical protein
MGKAISSVVSIAAPVVGGLVGGPAGAAIGSAVGGMLSSSAAGSAAQQAANTQAGMAQAGISEQQRQFDALQKLMAPYVTGGTGALSQQQALLGLGGVEAQQQAISQIEKSPFFQAMAQQGENAMLQQAAATGGLRGGNMQAALAQFRPGLLNQMVQQQFANLGGLTQIGQASAAGQAAQGMQTAGAIGNLLTQQGQALAGGQMAKAQSMAQMAQGAGKLAGLIF